MASATGKTAAELFGVFEIPKRGRGRLVATAVEIFYRHGFNAVGLDRVIEEAGVTSPATTRARSSRRSSTSSTSGSTTPRSADACS
jgi:AcrR family transcriptional regulator